LGRDKTSKAEVYFIYIGDLSVYAVIYTKLLIQDDAYKLANFACLVCMIVNLYVYECRRHKLREATFLRLKF
jgi:hypothetical protein